MSGPPPGGAKGGSEALLVRLFRLPLILAGVFFLLLAGTVPLTWAQQAVAGFTLLVVALGLHRYSRSYLLTLALVLLSCFATFRYAWWRFAQVSYFFRGGGTTALDAFFLWLLLGAECYAFLNLFLSYFQTLWPLRRAPVPLSDNVDLWPEVDLLIPTYNEPLSLVKYTALAAMNIDWPADRLNVYLLDDGRRAEFRSFCAEAGIGYMTRDNNRDAKAGNINRALGRLGAPFVAIFDSDHVPTRSFLQLTMGWFERDPKLAMLQTPHHLYSPDPFERNLRQFRVVPNEGELFYGVVQDGNDFWNAACFCGSCAVMRRAALDEVDGIAVETVTEDMHTSLRLQMGGWNTAYINIPQAAGLATELLSSHVRQRIRWARGMVQVLRLENPLFAPGLSIAQRLCYFNAMLHFLYALPRLIFLTAPLIYLIFGHTNIPGFAAAILAYAVPHLVLSYLTNSRIQGNRRYSFWNEIYETVLAPYILIPTVLAFVYPRRARFHVTPKGGVVNRSFFDSRIAGPFLLLLLFNFAGLLCALPRAIHFPQVTGFTPALTSLLNLPARMYDAGHLGTVCINVLWTLFNLVMLGVATGVASESQQRRRTVRVSMTVPARVVLPDGTLLKGATTDISSGGVMIRSEAPIHVEAGEAVSLVFAVLYGEATLPATVIEANDHVLRAHFDPLTTVLYSRADTWLDWGDTRERDHPLRNIGRIIQLAGFGIAEIARGTFRRTAELNVGAYAKGAALLLVAAVSLRLLLLPGLVPAQSRVTSLPPHPTQASTRTAADTPTNWVRSTSSLRDGHARNVVLSRAGGRQRTLYFTLPEDALVQTATLRLRYRCASIPASASSPGPAVDDELRISVNGMQVRALPLPEQGSVGDEAAASSAVPWHIETVELPPDLLVHTNELSFELLLPASSTGSATAGNASWAEVDTGSSGMGSSSTGSSIETLSSRLVLAADSAGKAAAKDLTAAPAPLREPKEPTGSLSAAVSASGRPGRLTGIGLPNRRVPARLCAGLSRHWVALFFSVLVVCFGLAALLQAMSQRHADRRLSVSPAGNG